MERGEVGLCPAVPYHRFIIIMSIIDNQHARNKVITILIIHFKKNQDTSRNLIL